MTMTEPTGISPGVADVAIEILERYACRRNGSNDECRADAAPVVLTLVTRSLVPLPAGLDVRVARRWVEDQPAQLHALGCFGGLGGLLLGTRAAADITPEFGALLETLHGQLPRWLNAMDWRSSSVSWPDYDLFFGPAGLVLAGGVPESASGLRPASDHLALLCDSPQLDRLRAGTEIDPRSAFNIGRINTGLGHGVTGVVAALRHAAETFDRGEDYRLPLRRASDWLVEQVYLADDGLITWPPIGRDGAAATGRSDDRQAWCYGAPGVAWTLWDAGRVLADSALQDLGAAAFESFCDVFDAHRHLDDDVRERLAVCHGAAGTLAVADAFARHCAMPAASELRQQLARYLRDRSNCIEWMAETDLTMLNGAGGILAVMLTAAGGRRDWLSLLALR